MNNHQNLIRDMVYGILNHCPQQRDTNSVGHRGNSRHPMQETGQISSEQVNRVVSLGMELLEAALGTSNQPQENVSTSSNSHCVLTAALNAYQQGHITKDQYIAVINALDEKNTGNIWNQEYLEANRYLNQYRK